MLASTIQTLKHVVKQDRKNILLIALSILLLVMSTLKAYHYTIKYGGGELKRRIVGARLLHTDKSPYHYNWQQGDDLRLFVSNMEQNIGGNGLTVTPATLYLLKPLSYLSYDKIRIIWTIFQAVLFFGTVLLVVKSLHKTITNEALLKIYLVALLFYISPIWLINIERGQIYILYAFIFSLMHYLFSLEKNKLAQYALGVVVIIAIWLRPLFIIITIPILFNKNKFTILGMLISGVVIGFITYLDWPLWASYLEAMNFYTTFNNEGIAPTTIVNTPVENLINYDKFKEDWQISGFYPIGYFISVNLNITLPHSIYTLLAIIVSVVFCIKYKNNDKLQTILLCFFCYVLYEILMPAPRGAYNLIFWLYPILFISSYKLSRSTITLGILGFCFIQGWPFYFPYLGTVGEGILVFLLLKHLLYYNHLSH